MGKILIRIFICKKFEFMSLQNLLNLLSTKKLFNKNLKVAFAITLKCIKRKNKIMTNFWKKFGLAEQNKNLKFEYFQIKPSKSNKTIKWEIFI